MAELKERSTRTRFDERTSLVLFVLLAVGLGGGVVTLAVRAVLPAGAALGSAVSASAAGVIVIALDEGREGLRRLFRRLTIWRVGVGYWLFSLFFLAAAVVLGSLVNPLFRGAPVRLDQVKLTWTIVPMFVAFVVFAGLGQELGWTGFLVHRLQARIGALAACIVRALIVAVWHLPVFLYGPGGSAALAGFPYGGWVAEKGFLGAWGTALFCFMLPWSILLTWMYNNTRGSTLLVAVLHGSEIWAAAWMASAGLKPADLDNYWGYGAIMVATSVILVMASGPRHLSHRGERVSDRPSGAWEGA
jgi:membrane protease YdiL (CAAX protease family)